MRPFLYLLKRNFINYLKSIKHKPTKVIPFIFYGAFIILMIFSMSQKASSAEEYKDPKYFVAISAFVSLVFLIHSLYGGITRKNFRYNMSDVNIIFTSPIKPQNVLLYGFLREISFIFAFGLFFIFQIPALGNNFKFTSFGIPVFIFTLFIFAITVSFISLLIYGIFTKFYKYKDNAVKISKGIIILLFATLALYIYSISNGDLLNATLVFFNKSFWNHIPISGWALSLFKQCLTGFNPSTILYLGLLIIICIICASVLYNLNLDYYEDALPSAEQNEVAQSYKNSGYDTKQLSQLRKARKPLARRKSTINYSSTYAKAIFLRHLLEYKKTGFYFLNILSGIYFIASISFGLYFKAPLYVFFFISIYFMVLSTYSGKWSTDFSGHYIFLIPASSASKLFYSTLSSILKYVVDSLILFLPAGILTGTNPLEILLIIIAYISFGAISTYGAVLNYKLFDRVSNQMMKGMFMMITLFVFIIPGIIIGAILSFYLNFLGNYSLYLSFILYNSLASLIIVQAAKGIYDSIET